MKKQLAVVLTAAMLTLPTNGLVFAEETTQPTQAIEVTAETTVTDTNTAVETVADSEVTTKDNTTGSTETADTATQESTTGTEVTENETATDVEATKDSEEAKDEVDANVEETAVVDADGQAVDPTALPGDTLHWLETLIEKIKVALTFDPMKKAELLEKQAAEDLAEATALVKEGEDSEKQVDEQQVEEALTSYTTKVEKALEFLDKVENTDSDEYNKLQEALTKVNTNNVVVLGSLLEKLPAQAAEKVALNIVRSMEKAIARAEKMERKLAQHDQVESEVAVDAEADADADVNAEATLETDAEVTAQESTEAADTETVEAKNDSEVQLSKEAMETLKQFAMALGLEKAPQGNAWGYYYKHDKAGKEAAKAAAKALVKKQVTEQTVQPVQTTKTQVETKVQKIQPKNTEVKGSLNKDSDRDENNRKDNDHKTEKKENGNRGQGRD